MVVAASAPACGAVDLSIGNGNAVARVIACDYVLTADKGDLNVVDPDQVGAGEGDGIAAPDILRVQLSEVHVLDDDVLGTVRKTDSFAADYAFGAFADDALVGADVDGS